MPVLDNFDMMTQGDAGNLCWAAAGLSIASYFDRLTGIPARWPRLCDYVMAVFNLNDGIPPNSIRCCDGNNLLEPTCNQPRWLPDALAVSKNAGNFVSNSVSYDDIRSEIDARRPIGVDIESSTGSHVIVILGYDDADNQRLMVGDPAPDAPSNALIAYDELCTNYRHLGGIWNQTYFTRNG
jgi:hypothetical protein